MDARAAALRLKLATVKAEAGRLYADLLRQERMAPEQLAALNDQRMSAMALHAFDGSSFYRELYGSAGLTRSDLRDPEALTSLPVLDRTLVKDNVDAILVGSVEDTRAALTGGSTGQPLRTYHDTSASLITLAWRMFRWWGIQPHDDVVHIGRWPVDRKARLTTAVSWWPTRVEHVDASKLDPGAIEAFLAYLAKRRPRLVEGYVGALHEIASYARQRDIALPAPVAVGATAAPLTVEGRSSLQQAWGAPVHDQYRCAEIPWMAGECGRRDGLHVFADLRRIEVLDDAAGVAAPGVTGDIVVSDLSNRAFPLLRYRLGDRGALRAEPCACGVTLPLMDPPDGRTVDMIRLPDGTIVAGGLFAIFSAVPDAVRQFQLHQDADHDITLRVVLGSSLRAREEVETVAEALRQRFGRQVAVTVQHVDALPYTGGKLKYVTSDVPPPG